MQMNFTVAIDFTVSNGNPNSPDSLHYVNPYQLNQYAAAITAVGEIIQDYASDNMFPALGFGARLPDNTVSNDFPLNFQKENPSCHGVQGILSAYYQALHQVQLDGPTKLAPVINHVAKFADEGRRGIKYCVLLIITNGMITDMLDTKAAIFNSSTLPLSIIIVGVGDSDFKEMKILVGADERFSYGGLYPERDIVQFVPFRDFLKEGTNIKPFLTKTVLRKVQDQVLSYMGRFNIKPRPPVPTQMLGHQDNSQQEPPPSYNDAIGMGLTPDYNADPPPYGS